MMRVLLVNLVVAVLASCGSAPPPVAPAPPQPDCAAVLVTSHRLIAADHASPAELERAQGVVALRCLEDHWPAAATSCISAAADLPAAHLCLTEHLTVAQHDRLMSALEPHTAAPEPEKPIDPPSRTLVEPEPSPAARPGTQAEIAARLHDEGLQHYAGKRYAKASGKFREAVARVPDPRYFLSLCLSLYQEGRFSEALATCSAGDRTQPSAATRQKLDTTSAIIRDAAAAQGVTLVE